jgi:hypothetical protein
MAQMMAQLTHQRIIQMEDDVTINQEDLKGLAP